MITVDQYNQLRQYDVFKYLTMQQFDKLTQQMTFRQIAKNQILFYEGDARDKLYFVDKGYIKIEQYNALGEFVYLDFIKQGTFFPYGGIFIDECYHYTASAVTEVSLFYISTELYENLVTHNLKQMKSICHKLSNILRFHELKLRNTLTKNATDRVIQALTILYLDLARTNKKMPFPITTLELAKLSGTTRETVSKVLKQLEQQHRISYDKKIITYLDSDFFSQHIS